MRREDQTTDVGGSASGEPAFAEADEQTAPAELQAAFAETRTVLRVPFLDLLWRVLAEQPDFFLAAWAWLAPILGSEAAERAADDLRRGAVIQLAIGVPAHRAFRGDLSRWEIGADDRQRISNYNMAEHYLLPKLLLATELMLSELRRDAEKPRARGALVEALPRGVAPGMPPIGPMNPADARGEIVDLFAEIRMRHGSETLADYYRTIARAGDFLRIAWNPLRPIVGDPEYTSQLRRLVQRSAQLCTELRTLAIADLRAAAPPPSLETIRALNFFRNRLIPATLVELTIIKGLTDGPETATRNSYSLTETAS